MNRWQVALLLGIGVPLFFPGIPEAYFLLTYPHRTGWDAGKWAMVLTPNVLLLVIVGSLVTGIYLAATRPR